MQEPVDAERSALGKTTLRVGLAGLIPVFTGAAYMAGLSYHHAYVFAFGIPEKIIAKSASDFFVYAYMAMSETLFRLLSSTGLLILVFAVFAVYMWLAISWLESRAQQSRRLQSVRERVRSQPLLRRLGNALLVPVFAIAAGYLAFALTVVFILPEAFGQHAGRSRALDDLAKFKQGCLKARGVRPCNEVFDGEKRIANGFVIDSSESYMAVYENGLVRTMPVEGKHFLSRPITD